MVVAEVTAPKSIVVAKSATVSLRVISISTVVTEVAILTAEGVWLEVTSPTVSVLGEACTFFYWLRTLTVAYIGATVNFVIGYLSEISFGVAVL